MLGFRPPTTPAMLDLEERLSGFDEARFARRFEEAGGSWVALAREGWRSYDGSHLHEDSARRLSDELARAIAQRRREETLQETRGDGERTARLESEASSRVAAPSPLLHVSTP